MKSIKRVFILIMVLCLCTISTNVFAAEVSGTETNSVDYLNYDFPEGAEVLYQGEDGVIYTNPSDSNGEISETATARAVEYNQVWIDAGRVVSSQFAVSNPHRLGGNGFGRLRLESNDPSVKMNVSVSNGSTALYLALQTISVGSDKEITFDFNSLSANLIVHYSTNKISSQHGMRLNCWLS